MAKKNSKDLRPIVDAFMAEIEEAVTRRVNEEFANRFDELREDILKGSARAPSVSRRGAASRSTVRAAPRRTLRKAEMRPCPVTGILNSARRYSYLMPEHRTKENLEKYRGWTHRDGDEAAAPAQAKRGGRRTTKPKAAAKKAGAPKRGRGRPRKVQPVPPQSE